MEKDEWKEWIKCNVLEIIILILVLVLVINTFSKSTTTQEKLPEEPVEQPQENIPAEQQPAAEGSIIKEEVSEETGKV